MSLVKKLMESKRKPINEETTMGVPVKIRYDGLSGLTIEGKRNSVTCKLSKSQIDKIFLHGQTVEASADFTSP